MVNWLRHMCESLIMDAISAMLDGPRAQGAFLLKAVFAGDWSLSVEDHAALSVVVVTQGRAVFRGVDGEHVASTGDVVLVRGPDPYVVASGPGVGEDIRILPGQVCVDPRGSLLEDAMSLGVRTWGNTRSPEATVMLIGAYERETSVGNLLLHGWPHVLVVSGLDSPICSLLADELARDVAGQEAVLDRLLDLLVVMALRTLGPTSGEDEGSDVLVDQALRLLQEHPGDPWTVESLARAVGLSRASLARRFGARVGLPPLRYLTRWRLALAADMVAGSDLTLAAIANRVGYANAFALSAAFKREHGLSPRHHRLGLPARRVFAMHAEGTT